MSIKYDPWQTQEKMRTLVPTIRFAIDANTGCWDVVSHVASHKAKYPRVNVLTNGVRKSVRLHRYFFPLFHGEIKEGNLILHKCDNRMCVNPDHLYQGNDVDNTKDKIRNGNLRFGDDHGMSKLTSKEVVEIRAKWKQGCYTQVELGNMYGVNSAHICAILKGKFWKKV